MLVGKRMPTICAVVGCKNRQRKQCGVSFYRFPKEDPDRRRQWIAFVSRRNSNKSAWKPGKGDRLCSDHFISGKKSDKPGNPDYVPSVKPKKSPRKSSESSSLSSAAMNRFKRLTRRTQVKEQKCRDLERSNQESRNEQLRCEQHQHAVNHDHAYTLRNGEETGGLQGQELATNERLEVTPSTPVYEELELATINEEAILIEDEMINEGVEVAMMDDGHEQTNETEVFIKSCEISIPVEVGKGNECVYAYQCFLHVECQTEMEWSTIEAKISDMERSLNGKVELCVEKILLGNDKLTRYYTGLPSYGSFVALAEYLEPKALHLQSWRGGSETGISSANEGDLQQRGSNSRCFASLSIANQLFAVLIRLRRGLESLCVCVRFGISETTYSRMFTTWILFLSRELRALFPFPSRQQIVQWMPKCFSKVRNTRIIIDCFEIECQRPSGLMNSSITYSQYKSRNTWKVLVGCTPAGLVSFVSEAWGGTHFGQRNHRKIWIAGSA